MMLAIFVEFVDTCQKNLVIFVDTSKEKAEFFRSAQQCEWASIRIITNLQVLPIYWKKKVIFIDMSEKIDEFVD